MRGIEHAQLDLFVRLNIVREQNTRLLPGRAAFREFVFHNPLDEVFAEQRGAVFNAALTIEASNIRRSNRWGNAINHAGRE